MLCKVVLYSTLISLGTHFSARVAVRRRRPGPTQADTPEKDTSDDGLQWHGWIQDHYSLWLNLPELVIICGSLYNTMSFQA